ncbi:MAG: hypothetical protein COV44_10600 [Deltaproteobacteria bacterium CG11_big_fil_rev_8_21_14_0_20_45_16]|nr:MAG: hypothetical protein COV44_10600 [Deltaproteobacteria bacterium CG11_big_fil_rev_8_21_14_0_20_45_16]
MTPAPRFGGIEKTCVFVYLLRANTFPQSPRGLSGMAFDLFGIHLLFKIVKLLDPALGIWQQDSLF